MDRSLVNKSLVQNRKKQARLLLYGSPLLLILLGWGVVHFMRDFGIENDWRYTDFSQIESVRLFREFMRINTGYPSGNEIPGAEFLARELARDGIEAHVERLGHRNANLWAVLEGEDRQALVLHNHIDVDPIRAPGQWTHPPFSGFIDLPFIIGRGAFDMKSLTIAQLMAVKELARSRARLERSVIFLATGDEERDSWHGTRWLLKHHPDLVSRFDVVLTEGGAVEATSLEEVKYWGTEFLQKTFIEIRVCHGNRATLEALFTDIHTTDYPPADPEGLPEEIVAFLEHYAQTRARPLFRESLEGYLAGASGFDSLPPNLKSMLRNSMSAFPVIESVGGGYELRVVAQLLPWMPVRDAMDEVMPDGLPGFSVAMDLPHEHLEMEEIAHPIYDFIHDYMEDTHPRFVHGPLFLPWTATDARFFRAAGIPAFGFSPFLLLSGDAQKITGPDERMAAPAFLNGVEIIVDLVKKWST